MKHIIAATLTAAALGMAAPALAQEAAAPADESSAAQAAAAQAGDTVYDQAGDVVGTIESVEGGNFVISTGSNKATLSLSVLAQGPKGPVIGMTKTQLDTAIQSAQSEAQPEAAN